MNVEELRDYCLSKSGSEESFPFDDKTIVFKIGGKIFAIVPLFKEECSITLKCNPERAIQLREEYDEIIPGFHMNKKHWNTIKCERELTDTKIKELIDHSYDLISSKLPKKWKAKVNE